MAEYYAVLSNAVANLGTAAPEARRAVYDKARNALIAQLKAIDPPLPAAEISRQRLELEEAIRRVERESSSGQAASAPQRAAGPRPIHPEAPPSAMRPNGPARSASAGGAERRPAAHGSPQEIFRRAIQDAEGRAQAGMQRAPEPRAPQPAERMAVPPMGRTSPPLERAAPTARPQPRPVPAGLNGGAQSSSERFQRDQRTPSPPLRGYGDAARFAETQAGDHERDWENEAPPSARRAAQEAELGSAAKPRMEAFAQPSADQREDINHPVRRSRLPAMLLLGLIAAVGIGIAAMAWSQREIVSDILASFDNGGDVPAAATSAVAPASGADPKASDRLLAGAEAPQPSTLSQPASSAPTEPERSVRVISPGPTPLATAPGTPMAEAPGAVGSIAGAGNAAPAETPTQLAAALPQQPAASGAAPSSGAAGAPRAVLYEQPIDLAAAGAGEIALDAEVTWMYVDGGADGPKIVANVNVPDRGMTVEMVLAKNTDPTLPASHLIELMINTSDNFPGQGISQVPRLALKASETAQAQSLIGVTATVADSLFWVALSGADADVATNLGMLANLSWFDVPLVYQNGQRAILSIEKGASGERAFVQALTAWSATASVAAPAPSPSFTPPAPSTTLPAPAPSVTPSAPSPLLAPPVPSLSPAP